MPAAPPATTRWLELRARRTLAQLLAQRRLQRAIGAIYLPASERLLVPELQWHAGEPPETYPSGL